MKSYTSGNNITIKVAKADDLYDLKFSGPQINITTPENKTYYGSMSGYYPGTWSFDNDQNAEVPQDWVDNSQAGCSARVVSDKMGHKKVVHLDDDSGNKVYFDNFFPVQYFSRLDRDRYRGCYDTRGIDFCL